LAGGSAALTFVILAAFAAGVGVLTTNQLRSQFIGQVTNAANRLHRQLSTGPSNLRWVVPGYQPNCDTSFLQEYVAASHAQIRIFDASGLTLCTQNTFRTKGAKPPTPTPSFPAPSSAGTNPNQLGYVTVTRQVEFHPGRGWLLYAQPLSDLDHTLARVRLFLLLGVLGGTVLALLAGLATAARAIRPIVELTAAAREIERTRDPRRHVPLPKADDEVAELARTLEGMLQSLDAARSGTETMLERQREFVADASHELRTPLTSVLASLELLAEELDGEQADTAQAALRSARRMRRLVGDLLLLARADAKRAPPHHPTHLDDVVMDATAEIGPMAEDHDMRIDVSPVVVSGAGDELHRLVLNLLENAVKHTPPGTHIGVSTTQIDGDVTLTVQDDGPGIPPDLGEHVFDRFVRGGRDGPRGSGLGLSIVRAVAEAHGGSVALESAHPGHGARFVVRLPAAEPAAPAEPAPTADEPAANGAAAGGHTSTTTGRTIGRRRSRS
jgi:signal transduction histidine kinase